MRVAVPNRIQRADRQCLLPRAGQTGYAYEKISSSRNVCEASDLLLNRYFKLELK